MHTARVCFVCVSCIAQTRYNEEDERAIVNGAHTNATLQQLVHKYVELFVLCPNCRLPESSKFTSLHFSSRLLSLVSLVAGSPLGPSFLWSFVFPLGSLFSFPLLFLDLPLASPHLHTPARLVIFFLVVVFRFLEGGAWGERVGGGG